MATDPKQPEFVMEVTDKTKADVKGLFCSNKSLQDMSTFGLGGTLIEYEDRLMLLEIAQVPSQESLFIIK